MVTLVIAVDWAVGAAWNAATEGPAPARSSIAADATGAATTSTPGGGPDTSVPVLPRDQLDERVDSPALSDSPWRAGYFSEFARLRYDYVPYLYSQAAENRGRYINTGGGARRSYQPDATGHMPELWMFGGSALWGEGQRDRHTIPSQIARLAEADGLPVRVVNRGERAWVIWQEALLFERALAHEGAPDLAVFYDGANELGVQFEQRYPEPTPADLDNWTRLLTGRGLEPGQPQAEPEVDVGMRTALSDLWNQYRSTSALGRLAGNVGSIFAIQPAGAQGGPPDDEVTTGDAEARNAAAIYERGRALTQLIGSEAGVPTMFFWQPAFGDSADYRALARRMAPETIDLTRVLDDLDEPVYVDVIHTNELGARLVAEAMWDDLRPAVEAWYDEN